MGANCVFIIQVGSVGIAYRRYVVACTIRRGDVNPAPGEREPRFQSVAFFARVLGGIMQRSGAHKVCAHNQSYPPKRCVYHYTIHVLTLNHVLCDYQPCVIQTLLVGVLSCFNAHVVVFSQSRRHPAPRPRLRSHPAPSY